MRILIPCGGTRGDTQPCVALAVALRKKGNEVCFYVPTTHVKLCQDQGFQTAEYKLDMESMVEEVLAGMDRRSFGTGLAFLKKGLELMNKPEMKEWAKTSLPQFWKLAQEFQPDLIVMSKGLPVLSICEKLRIPFVLITFQALAPTQEFPPILLNDGMPLKWFPSWHKWLGQTFLPLAQKKGLAMFGADEFAKDVLQLQDPVVDMELTATMNQWCPTLIAAAPEVIPPPKDYGAHQHFTGWWFLGETTDDFAPAEELVSFLEAAGPPVVCVGFGSMKGNDTMSGELSRIALAALRAAGARGVLLGGWAGLTRERLGAQAGDEELKAWAAGHVMEVRAAPHSWLFPRVRAVCHHGGAGTLAAGLRAGRPTVVVPFLADQPFWAAQVEAQGLGRRAPPVTRVSAEVLTELLKDVATNEAMLAKAMAVGKAISSRDSLGDALEYIDCFMETFPYPWRVDCQERSAEAAAQRRRTWRVDTAQERACCWCPRSYIKGFPPVGDEETA